MLLSHVTKVMGFNPETASPLAWAQVAYMYTLDPTW